MESAASPRDDPARPPVRVAPLAILLSAGLLLWMGRAVFTGDVPLTGDLLHFHYPLREFYARALAGGHRVSWMPGLFNGFSVVGEGQLGAFHPLHWWLYSSLPLPRAFAVELVAAYPVIFAGTWLWLRGWTPPGPAAFGALLFTFCGFTVSHGAHPNMVSVVAHVPWLLWAVHRLLLAAGPWRALRWSVLVGVLVASQLLLGHPQSVWMSGVLVSGYVAWMWPSVAAGARAARVGLLGLGVGLGLAMSAPQLLATFDAVSHSIRPVRDAAFATQFSLAPAQLGQLVLPYAAWGRVLRWNEMPGAGDEYGVYAGAVGLVLGAWWLALRAPASGMPSSRYVGRWALLAGVFGVWMATGAHGRVYLLQTWLPIVGQFRAPVRYVFFAHLAVACLGACALTALTSSADRAWLRRALWAPWGLTAVVAAAALLASGPGGAGDPAGGRALAVWVGPLTCAVAAGLLTLAARGARWAVPCLVVLAAGDLAAYGLGGVIAWQDFVPQAQVVPLLGDASRRPPPGEGRIVRGGFPNLWLLAGYRMVDGYVAIAPARQLRYDEVPALRVSGVRFAHASVLPPAVTQGAELFAGEWFRIPDPRPRAWAVSRVRVSRVPADDIAAIDVSREALVTHPLPLAGGPAGPVAVVLDVPGEIRLRTDAPGRTLVVLSERYDGGWSADVDGTPAVVEPVNGDFLGCVVEAGRHGVTFTFAPAYLASGAWVSVAGALASVALAGISWRRERSRPGPA